MTKISDSVLNIIYLQLLTSNTVQNIWKIHGKERNISDKIKYTKDVESWTTETALISWIRVESFLSSSTSCGEKN